MPADQKEKRRTLARKVILNSTQFIESHRELLKLQEEATGSGLTFVDTDFENIAGLQHLDAVTFAAINASITAINSVLRADSLLHLKAYLRLIPE